MASHLNSLFWIDTFNIVASFSYLLIIEIALQHNQFTKKSLRSVRRSYSSPKTSASLLRAAIKLALSNSLFPLKAWKKDVYSRGTRPMPIVVTLWFFLYNLVLCRFYRILFLSKRLFFSWSMWANFFLFSNEGDVTCSTNALLFVIAFFALSEDTKHWKIPNPYAKWRLRFSVQS